MASYYNRFIPHFANIAVPLMNWLWKDQTKHLIWDRQSLTALKHLKKDLMSQPILASPDFSKPFVVQTDALQYKDRAVWAQISKGIEHPIEYLSQKVHPIEQWYSTIEKHWQ